MENLIKKKTKPKMKQKQQPIVDLEPDAPMHHRWPPSALHHGTFTLAYREALAWSPQLP